MTTTPNSIGPGEGVAVFRLPIPITAELDRLRLALTEAQAQSELAEVESRLREMRGYLAKTADNIEGGNYGWTGSEAEQFIDDLLALSEGRELT